MKNCLNKKRHIKIHGVTLIEILVAMSILTVGLFMVYNVFPMGFAVSYRTKNHTIATQLAQQKLEELITNKRIATCRKDTTTGCLVRPLEPNPSNPDYDMFFDCRKFYGGEFNTNSNKVQDATYCGAYSGPIDSPTSWQAFPNPTSDPNNIYWYHIDVTRAIDPAQKYRSTGNLIRLTVTVRGPIADMNQWDLLTTAKGQRLPAEVYLVTYVTNSASKNLNAVNIDNSYNETFRDGKFRNGLFDNQKGMPAPNYDFFTDDTDDDTGQKKYNGRMIRVSNIRNFSMFSHNLNVDEKQDRGQVKYYEKYVPPDPDYPSGHPLYNLLIPRDVALTVRAGNYYGLDNVLIVRNTKVYMRDPLDPSDRILIREINVTQTNKIMTIRPCSSVVNNIESTENIPGFLVLNEPLFGVSQSDVDINFNDMYNQISPHANWQIPPHIDPYIIDRERAHGTDIYESSNIAYALFKPYYNGELKDGDSVAPDDEKRKILFAPPDSSTFDAWRYSYKIPYQGSRQAGTFDIIDYLDDPSISQPINPDPNWGPGFRQLIHPDRFIPGDIDFACRRMHMREGTDYGDYDEWNSRWEYHKDKYTNRLKLILNFRFPADGLPIYQRVDPTTPPDPKDRWIDKIIPTDSVFATEPDFNFEYEFNYYVVPLISVKGLHH